MLRSVAAAALLIGGVWGLVVRQRIVWKERQFLAEVEVGTPARKYNLAIDTGLTTLWLYGTGCRDCGEHENTFDPTKSTTFLPLGRRFDSINGVNGSVGSDVVRFGGLELPGQELGVAEHQAAQRFPSKADGVLGLGRAMRTADLKLRPLFDAVGKELYTVYVKRGEHDDDEGQITYGELDTSHCSEEVTFVDVKYPFFYFESQGLSFDGKTFNGTYQTTINPHQDIWILPKNINDALKKAFYSEDLKSGKVDCERDLPSVSLVVKGQLFKIPGKYLIKRVADACYLNTYAPLYDSDEISVGKQFFYSYCVVYDNEKHKNGVAKVKDLNSVRF